MALAVLLAACGGPSPDVTPSASSPVAVAGHAESAKDDFRLVFDMPRTTYRADDAIAGLATLEYHGQAATSLGTPYGGPFGFAFVEVNGTRKVEPIFLESCSTRSIRPGEALTSEIVKSGGGDSFSATFLAGQAVQLPVGDWDISAEAQFSIGCGQGFFLESTIRVHVTP